MSDLHAKAQRAGIDSSYNDVWGKPHLVPDETVHALLTVLNGDSAPAFAPTETFIIPAGKRSRMDASGSRRFEVVNENEQVAAEGEILQGAVMLPALSAGYYRLKLTGPHDKEQFLIAAPPSCWMPESLMHGKRVWGLSAQLYGLRSRKNWGVGDLGDLQLLVKKAARLGANVVGINPVHAMFDANPGHLSPYAPSNRVFLNLVYIQVDNVDGFLQCAEAQRLYKEKSFQEHLAHARQAEYVDYAAAAALKRPILQALYRHFSEQASSEKFSRFKAQGGRPLFLQAVFDALCSDFAQKEGRFIPWSQWPAPFQNPASEEVRIFAESHAGEVEYYLWLQWIADNQLGLVQQTALSSGMQVGIYRDLAVGSDKAGAEVWMAPEAFISGFSIGAPPDEYSPKGQNWGLPALHPGMLKRHRFSTFISLLRANMRHARALRIDHAFGLSRLFLIPEGKEAGQGAYLNYPFEEMLAIIRVESHMQQCMVIGEDLGTFPPNYKDAAAESGIFSYKLLYFERDGDQYLPPEYYPRRSLAMLSTHDLPTLQGWLASADIDERERLKLYPDAELEVKDRENRKKDITALVSAMQDENILSEGAGPVSFEQVQRYLCKSPAAVVMAQLEDVLGVKIQANLPTTTDERPNWRMKLPAALETLTDETGPLSLVARAMDKERAVPLAEVPRATYRLQFHKDFTFEDAVRVLPYLAALGISHVYASPYLKARPGSMHGYDITDHAKINPELGGEEGYEKFLAGLKTCGLSHILDFVPNHMAVGGSDNLWWMSVLEWGVHSPFAEYFDIDWSPRTPEAEPKLLVPFLGGHYGDVLDQGELGLAFDKEAGSFSVTYGDTCFPICPKDYGHIMESLPAAPDYVQGQELKKHLSLKPELHGIIQTQVEAINGDTGLLHALLERQHYRLAFWRTAASDINYRRFFDITHLAGMRVEVPALFDAMHAYVLGRIKSGDLQGLRIDHVDGLADPAGYCRKLRENAGAHAYITVEKILGMHEALPEDWNIHGTSGYDALSLIGDIFVDTRKEKLFDRIYQRFTGRETALDPLVYQAKLQIMETSLASELQALALLLKRIMAHSPYMRDYPLDTLRQALKEIIGRFPIYRTYVTASHFTPADMHTVEGATTRAKKHSSLADVSIYDVIASMLLLDERPVEEKSELFVRKFQQLSGPVMAKGMEDTTFYRYNRLISLNEVGGNPGRFGLSVKAFHETNAKRARAWPDSMIATATHDTKRGEDMRMRLHALSEIPAEWDRHLREWAAVNRSRRGMVDGISAPSRGDEYFIYQTLLGSWPLELLQLPLKEAAKERYLARLDEYMIKALRESKLHSSWSQPDEAYESAVRDFVHALLEGNENNVFLEKFLPLAKRLAERGAVNSLSQTVLKFTVPGVPDIYQGCEYWDFSLVDPDNRRPVDYSARQQTLEQKPPGIEALLTDWQDGRIKQHLIAALLAHRKAFSALYRFGSYVPLKMKGRHAKHVLAFMREYNDQRIIVILPVRTCHLEDGELLTRPSFWEDTYVSLPQIGKYRNLITAKSITSGALELSACLAEFPCAVLACEMKES